MSSSRILKIIHRTRYEYVAPVLESQNAGHFLPAIFQDQVLLEQKVSIIPEPVEISTHKNYFGNLITLFRCDQPHIIFEAVSELKIEKRPILEFTSGPTVKEAMDIFKNKAETLPKVCWAYLPNTVATLHIHELHKEFEAIFFQHTDYITACKALMHHVFINFKFDGSVSDVNTPLQQIFTQRKGVCQDFSHILLSAFRSMGIPTQYISGYIETLPPAGKEKLIGVDASHAWVSVFVPHCGWLDLDPTNDIGISSQHVSIARGRDYHDVTPLKGSFVGDGQHQLSVSVDVREFVPAQTMSSQAQVAQPMMPPSPIRPAQFSSEQ